jgi:lipopolysaccharide assembly outer membrane protein LptD (OstA)
LILKFISIFFLIAIIFTTRANASVRTSNFGFKPIRDTIIKLDTIKNQKGNKGKKSKATSATKKAGAPADTSKNSGELKEEVTSHAEDSTFVDQVNEITYLYGKARVTYGDFELDADYIRLDKKNHLLFAKGSIDPITKRYVGRPISKQGKEKPLLSDSLLFDYKSKKGKLYNPASEQDGSFLSGGQAKKLNETEIAYRNVIFSTCDLPYPDTHFGIVITKGIAEKNRIISGPAYLEIEGIPLPLAIPFGFFPKPDTRTSGVIIPTFGEDAKLGFYLRNFGYYVGISDYMDLTNMGTIYSKGSYELNTTLHYLKRYKYGGTLSLSYGSHNYGLEGDPPTRDFNVTWTHTQDPNANPGSTLSASVNAGTSTFYQNNPSASNYNLQALTQNNLRSTVNYSKTWAGTPFNLSVGLSHSQDLTNKTVTLDLPTLSFTMASLSPFDSKDRVGDPKWYQKITVSYSLQANNEINAIPESQLFKGNTLLKDMQTSIVHQIPIGLSLNFLKYFQFSSSVNYTEHWYLQTIRKNYARGSTSGSDSLVTDTVNGFKRAGTYSLSTGVSTKVYGVINFKKGNVEAIRDVITPTLSFSYNPDFSAPGYGYYKTAISNATIPYPYQALKYSIFEDGFPSAGRQAGIGLNLDNTIQMKLKPKATDTSGKPRKVSLLDGLTFSTFYNFAQDSLRLQPISFSAHTGILNNKVNLSIFGSLNPYENQVLDSISNGQVLRYTREINRYTLQDGRFPTLTSISFSVSGSLNSTSFNPQAPVQPQAGNTLSTINAQQAQRLAVINSDPSAYVDFNVPWNLSFNYSYSYNNNYISTSSSNTIMLSGDVNVTSKWKVQYSTNYDIRAQKLAVTSFGIYRDLHCWDLNFQWVPFGLYKSYNVTLKVKAAILQDLKLSKRSDYTSNQNFTQ